MTRRPRRAPIGARGARARSSSASGARARAARPRDPDTAVARASQGRVGPRRAALFTRTLSRPVSSHFNYRGLKVRYHRHRYFRATSRFLRDWHYRALHHQRALYHRQAPLEKPPSLLYSRALWVHKAGNPGRGVRTLRPGRVKVVSGPPAHRRRVQHHTFRPTHPSHQESPASPCTSRRAGRGAESSNETLLWSSRLRRR